EWEARADRLRERAIPLGLDLQGGVDVSLTIDRDAVVAQRVDSMIESIRRALEAEQISIQAERLEGRPAFRLRLSNPEDARMASNFLRDSFQGSIRGDFSEAALRSGPVVFELPQENLTQQIENSLQGAREAISKRVNALGVTQPRISLQRSEERRVGKER